MQENLKKILIKTKRQIFSEIIGNNSSLLQGEGYDFLELKEYEYGDDVKNIDWVISAKLKKPYVKVFHAQKELNINIIPILSGSIYFGSTKFKQDIIIEICSILGFCAIKQNDPFSSFIANEDVTLCTKKSKRLFSVNTMCEKISTYSCLGKSINYKNLTNSLFKKIKHKSILFLIGDFFDTKDLDLKLLSKKHEIIVIIVRDNFEEQPFALGDVNLIDANTNTKLNINLNQKTIHNYIKEVKKNDHILFEHLQNCNIRFTKIYTHELVLSKLLRLLR